MNLRWCTVFHHFLWNSTGIVARCCRIVVSNFSTWCCWWFYKPRMHSSKVSLAFRHEQIVRSRCLTEFCCIRSACHDRKRHVLYLFFFSGLRRCQSDAEVRCKPVKADMTDFFCIKVGDSPHLEDCTKFYRCSSVMDAQPCLCRCRRRNTAWDEESHLCTQQAAVTSCRVNGKFSGKLGSVDFPEEGFKKENDIIKSMFEGSNEKNSDGSNYARTQSPVDSSTLNFTAGDIVVVIDDDFPVWAISLAVSAAVTFAVGIILYFYWKTIFV